MSGRKILGNKCLSESRMQRNVDLLASWKTVVTAGDRASVVYGPALIAGTLSLWQLLWAQVTGHLRVRCSSEEICFACYLV